MQDKAPESPLKHVITKQERCQARMSHGTQLGKTPHEVHACHIKLWKPNRQVRELPHATGQAHASVREVFMRSWLCPHMTAGKPTQLDKPRGQCTMIHMNRVKDSWADTQSMVYPTHISWHAHTPRHEQPCKAAHTHLLTRE